MAASFDHERLDVFRLQLEFPRWTSGLLEEVAGGRPDKTREVRDHLSRAALPALLNIPEGNGKRGRPVRARFFDDARGSATECAACLDALVAIGACTEERVSEGKDRLLRVVAMLTKLVLRFSKDTIAEEESGYVTAEHEDECGPAEAGPREDEHDSGDARPESQDAAPEQE
jgi:four helix bundle protein